MKLGWIKYLLHSIVLLVIGGILLFFINLGYSYSWTGFAEFTPTNPDTVPSKTLWDWMELLVVPLVLALGAFILNRSEKNIERQNIEARAELEREIATDRQHEAALQTYFDRMSELLLKEKLRTTENVEVRDVARTRTISIMRVMDAKRNKLIIQFLTEAKLITDENSIFNRANMSEMNLQNLDLENVYLQGANLEHANLEYTKLRGANLTLSNLTLANLLSANLEDATLERAKLSYANLSYANLQYANLTRAKLDDVRLQHANLCYANLQGATLEHANLTNTLLGGANLEGANLTSVENISDYELNSVESLKDATMPNGIKYK